MPDCHFEAILPSWLKEFFAEHSEALLSDSERMKFAIELARQNVINGTGGPFGAAVFERSSGNLVAVGVNLVVQSNCSHAHAEMLALAIAEHRHVELAPLDVFLDKRIHLVFHYHMLDALPDHIKCKTKPF